MRSYLGRMTINSAIILTRKQVRPRRGETTHSQSLSSRRIFHALELLGIRVGEVETPRGELWPDSVRRLFAAHGGKNV